MDGSTGGRPFRTPETQRLDAFVDAAFAFAVSLLIIGGTEPLRSFADLATALARIPAFVFGFALIALFWSAHRTWSTLTPVRTGWTTFLSLAVVFAVLVFVFPLRLLAETATHYVSGGVLPGGRLMSSLTDLRWTYVIYGVAFAVLSGLNAALFAHAARALRGGEPLALRNGTQWATTWAIAAATGLISALIASTPLLRVAPWLPGVAYNLIPVGVGVVTWRNRRG
jgi:uncharacterized membrane protein